MAQTIRVHRRALQTECRGSSAELLRLSPYGSGLMACVLIPEGFFPPEVVHHIGEVAVRPGKHHVRRRRQDACQPFLHWEARGLPGGYAAIQRRDVLVAQLLE